MVKKSIFPLLLFFSFYLSSSAQADFYAGTWESENITLKKTGTLKIFISISNPFSEVLYPAILKINYDFTEISYQLLLVKNSTGELLIAQNKIPAAEFPFSLENPTNLLSGRLSKSSSSGNDILNFKAAKVREAGFMPLQGMDSLSSISSALNKLLAKESFKFKKINKQPWQSPLLNEIITPGNLGNYYGLTDSLTTKDKNLSLKLIALTANDKKFSASLNNQYLFEKEAPKNFNYTFKKVLKEGPNLICFFADDFPLAEKDSASLLVSFENKNYRLNFGENKNKEAGFIVGIIYYEPEFKEKPKEIITSISNEELLRNTLLIDSMFTKQKDLTFAIWDDALQDGDSISLSVNGKWILQNKLVTITPQFFKITLEAGVNNIVFVANNLGGVPPNTSILEIIDDRQRKAFNISTNLRQNNLVKIIYEVP